MKFYQIKRYFVFLFFVSSVLFCNAQLVDVRADYNSVGDCIFSATNNAKTPLFLNINFADLENTVFSETLPYVKKLEPGFNSLFTLERDLSSDVPRFNYEIKVFKSNPLPEIDLDFPYLLPFSEGEKVRVFDVAEFSGFWGNDEPKSWSATGFVVKSNQNVCASRKGIVVEISGNQRNGNPQTWYNTWANSITLLQPDGTLISYKNISNSANVKLNQVVQAGEIIGTVAPGRNELIVAIYYQSLHADDILFVIPEFVVEKNKRSILNSVEEYLVIHPYEVAGLEMSKKEKRKFLN